MRKAKEKTCRTKRGGKISTVKEGTVMMLDKLPGTALDFDERGASNAFSVIAPILDATGGLTLSQLATLTGLEGSTIQNWIKRGWVAPTVGKKYGERQVVRVMLINILRGTIRLEDIARLMEYINGEVNDLDDDIMHDTELYNLMCQMLTAMTRDNLHSREEIDEEIEKRLDRSFEGENRKRLRRVLLIMILGYRASYYRRMAESEFAELEYEY